MKYPIPKDLDTICFWCNKTTSLTNLNKCNLVCPVKNIQLCWEKHIKDYLINDCNSENQHKYNEIITATTYCNKCGSSNIKFCDKLIEETYSNNNLISTNDVFYCYECQEYFNNCLDSPENVLGDNYLQLEEKDLLKLFKSLRKINKSNSTNHSS